MIFRLALFAILIITAFLALYFFTRKKWDWSSYTSSLAMVFSALLVIPLGMFLWVTYENRLQLMEEFSGVSLGATTSDVKFIKGEPARQETNEGTTRWQYIDELNKGNSLDVNFENGLVTEISYTGTCEYCETINDFGIGTPYEKIVKKFGESKNIESSENQLERRFNYPDYQVFFVIREGRVIRQGIYQP